MAMCLRSQAQGLDQGSRITGEQYGLVGDLYVCFYFKPLGREYINTQVIYNLYTAYGGQDGRSGELYVT